MTPSPRPPARADDELCDVCNGTGKVGDRNSVARDYDAPLCTVCGGTGMTPPARVAPAEEGQQQPQDQRHELTTEKNQLKSSSHRDAGIVMDALIDERVFGYTWQPVSRDVDCCGPTVTHRLYGGVRSGHIRAERHADGHVRPMGGDEYSTGIRAAWLVVEAMHDAGWWIDIEHDTSGFLVTMEPFEPEDLRRVELRADTAPLAICRAALAATDSPPGAPVPELTSGAAATARSIPQAVAAAALTPETFNV